MKPICKNNFKRATDLANFLTRKENNMEINS